MKVIKEKLMTIECTQVAEPKAEDLVLVSQLLEIEAELWRAINKHPNYPLDPNDMMSILNEEAGEATREALNIRYGQSNIPTFRAELIQVGATVLRALVAIDEGRFKIINPECSLETLPKKVKLI